MRRVAALAAAALAGAAGKECLPCDPNDEPLPTPKLTAFANNGVRWPTMCIQNTPEGQEHHAFTIGDWGGIGSHAKTFDNTAQKRSFTWGLDDKAQHMVADLMKKVAVEAKPDYILNVGDNFYPGGVEAHCGNVDMCSYIQTGQWENLWVNIYDGNLGDLEWWGCLGNHDWGGFSYGRAWEQQFAFTWHHDRWLIPALYWERKVTYCDFSVDYYFLDTNKYDAKSPGEDPGHNICSGEHNVGKTCASVGGPTSAGHCLQWFRELFSDQLQWLEQRLNQSTADWQIVVTHFPPQYGAALWRDIAKKYGIDIFITGHRHQQEIHYNDRGSGWMNLDMSGSAWTVTGGGGGVTSEGSPGWESAYTQQYGFMDLTLAKEQIHIDMWSAVTRKMRRRVTVTPIGKFDYSRRRRSRRRRAFLDESAPEGSCARYGCMDTWESSYPCQCMKACIRARKCCFDFKDVCPVPMTQGARVAAGRGVGRQLEEEPPADFAEARRLRGGAERRLRPHSHAPYFEELNLTQEERCSAVRRRDNQYVGKARNRQDPDIYGKKIYGLSGDGLDDLQMTSFDGTVAMSDALPQDLVQTRSDLSAENCLEHCGGRSGYCDFFCGVGKACCAKDAPDDDELCKTAHGVGDASPFTEGGKHECVSIKDVDGNLFMKEMGAWPPEGTVVAAADDTSASAPGSSSESEEESPDSEDSLSDNFDQETFHTEPEARPTAPWWSWALGIGALSIAGGVGMLAWSKLESRSSRKRAPRGVSLRNGMSPVAQTDDDE